MRQNIYVHNRMQGKKNSTLDDKLLSMDDQPKRISSKIGSPPGALIHIGKVKAGKARVRCISYNKEGATEAEIENLDAINLGDKSINHWINIDGLHDDKLIAEIGRKFNLHNLLLEDVLNTASRPKMEEYENCILMSLKMVGLSARGKKMVSEQISLVMGENWVLSFQEKEGDVFDGIRERLQQKSGLMRKNSADFLFYRMLDTIVDYYYHVTEHFSDQLLELEEEVLHTQRRETPSILQKLRRQISNFRKAVLPLREAVTTLQKSQNPLVSKVTKRYLIDVGEHIVHITDSIETFRDLHSSIMDLYFTGISNRTNQIMQVLTIIATIFIPLTFVAGIYGMNFDIMPELHWEYGYLTVWIIMVVLAIGMLLMFRRKGWL